MIAATQPHKQSAYSGWLPFVCILIAIGLVAGSAISWVLSPSWGKHNPIADARAVGTVPSIAPPSNAAHQAPLAYVMNAEGIEIPTLKVRAPILPISTQDGVLEPPVNPKETGWWNGGAKPGAARGTAVITGHINYGGVEGALARIGTLDPGDLVIIHGKHDGKKASMKFKITGVRTYHKTKLPYAEIFDQRVVGRLALITCGGPFDATTGNYLDNIVAYAIPVKPGSPS